MPSLSELAAELLEADVPGVLSCPTIAMQKWGLALTSFLSLGVVLHLTGGSWAQRRSGSTRSEPGKDDSYQTTSWKFGPIITH